MSAYLLVILIAFAGAFVQSATGFGYALICMALWPMILPLKTAAAIEVITAFAMVTYLTFKLRRHINWSMLFWPLVMSTLASTVGVFAMLSSTEILLRRVLGAVILLLSVYFMFVSGKLRLKVNRRNGILAGLISGFFGGLLNIGGPPMVAYFLCATEDKMEYSATLQAYFCFTTIYIFFMHLILGNVNGEVARYGAVALCGVAAGTTAGLMVFKRLPMQLLKKAVYVFLFLVGIYLLIAG